jgi:hypothetical protein
VGIFSSHEDPAAPHALRDVWLGQPVAFVYVPRHLLRAAVISPSLVVLRDLAPLMARPFGEVVSAWGSTTWLVSRAQAPQLLADLGLAAELIEEVLAEIDHVLAAPARREQRRD